LTSPGQNGNKKETPPVPQTTRQADAVIAKFPSPFIAQIDCRNKTKPTGGGGCGVAAVASPRANITSTSLIV